MHRDVKKLIKEIEARGFVVEQGRSHLLVRRPEGNGTIAALPLTPGKGRWEKNLRSQLRQRGVL